MPTPIAQRLSQTEYLTDGVTTNWNFSFSGGYILTSHVKAYREVVATGEQIAITVTEPMLIGPFQLQITPALAAGDKLVIYRDTPKDLPLVDFTDESGFSEVSLDTNAKQAVFIAAETQDAVNTSSAFEAEEAASLAAASAAAATTKAAEALASANNALASANAALATPVAAPTTAAASKTPPVDADYLPLVDSAASFALKKLTWANLKATLQTAFAALFAAKGANADITSTSALATLTNVSSINGRFIGRQIAQVVESVTSAVATGTTIMPLDDTIPQQTEGDQYLSLAVTPTNAASTLEVDVTLNVSHSVGSTGIQVALFQDATANAIAGAFCLNATAAGLNTVTFKYTVAAGSTTARTFKVRAGDSSAGTLTVNGQSGTRMLGGILFSRITVKEILP